LTDQSTDRPTDRLTVVVCRFQMVGAEKLELSNPRIVDLQSCNASGPIKICLSGPKCIETIANVTMNPDLPISSKCGVAPPVIIVRTWSNVLSALVVSDVGRQCS